MSFLIFLTAACLLFTNGLTKKIYTSVIETESGPVRGQILTTVKKSMKYASFTGIPFGEPPIGYLRFKPPLEKKQWTRTLDATKEGHLCIQPFPLIPKLIIGSEDCLNLNVYTPHTNFSGSKDTLKPVMFWIYGGAFFFGSKLSTLLRPDFLLEEDVIVVSPNYRVGPMGFLNLYHQNATGNAGLKDQTLALKWVRKNIKKFGGDPNKVTIFGESAGAVSVDYHVLSDLSAGLFSQAISMSGSPLNLYWGLQTSKEAEAEAFELGLKLGIKTENKDALLSALYSTSAKDIVNNGFKLPPMAFRVTVEKKFDNVESFLTECSVKKYVSGSYNKVPYMMGFTSNEAKAGALVPDTYLVELFKQGLKLLSQAGITLKIPIIEKFVASPYKIRLSLKNYKDMIETCSDLFFVTGINSKQRLMNLRNEHPIYYYRFSFVPKTFLGGIISGTSIDETFQGAGHSEDLKYLFYSPGRSINKPDVTLTISRFVRLLTNFAKYGNPTPLGEDDPLLNITWPNSGKDGLLLDISNDLTIQPRPISSRVNDYELIGVGNSSLMNECSDGF